MRTVHLAAALVGLAACAAPERSAPPAPAPEPTVPQASTSPAPPVVSALPYDDPALRCTPALRGLPPDQEGAVPGCPKLDQQSVCGSITQVELNPSATAKARQKIPNACCYPNVAAAASCAAR